MNMGVCVCMSVCARVCARVSVCMLGRTHSLHGECFNYSQKSETSATLKWPGNTRNTKEQERALCSDKNKVCWTRGMTGLEELIL